jgi:pilus assembly protein CpaB
MNKRNLILMAAALVAAFTAVIMRNQLAEKSNPVETEVTKRILVSKHDLTPGNFIDAANDIDWADPTGNEGEMPVIHEGEIKRGDFQGGVIRRAVKAGVPVSIADITKSGEGGFLSAVLEPGMRAVAIEVNATTGAAGFIAPGDRVDLIVTHRIKTSRDADPNVSETVVSETFVQNIRVVAVDQSLDNPENKAVLAKNVTVEVTERQAEQVAVAREMGKVSLALRSALTKDQAEKEMPGAYTRDSDVSQILERKANIVPRVQVIRGGAKEEIQFLDQGAQK